MFVILLTYKKSLKVVDQHIPAHIDFLDNGYRSSYFLVSGRKNPRTGGVIVSQLNDRNQVEEIIKQDPFHIHGIADYEIIEFIPTKYHPDFSRFIEKK